MRKLSCKRKLSTIKSTTTILQCFCCFLLPLGQSVRELLLSLTFKCKYIQDLLGLAWGWKGGLWGSSVISFTPGSALHPTVNLAASLETKTQCCSIDFSPPSMHFHPQVPWLQVAGVQGPAEVAAWAELIQGSRQAPLAPHALPLSLNLSCSHQAGGCLVFGYCLHCKGGNCFCNCGPRGCTFLLQLNPYQTSRCSDNIDWIGVCWQTLTCSLNNVRKMLLSFLAFLKSLPSSWLKPYLQ